eukprot:3011300-Rhodomonas_salina.1
MRRFSTCAQNRPPISTPKDPVASKNVLLGTTGYCGQHGTRRCSAFAVARRMTEAIYRDLQTLLDTLAAPTPAQYRTRAIGQRSAIYW